jgi:hypothetical protein
MGSLLSVCIWRWTRTGSPPLLKRGLGERAQDGDAPEFLDGLQHVAGDHLGRLAVRDHEHGGRSGDGPEAALRQVETG